MEGVRCWLVFEEGTLHQEGKGGKICADQIKKHATLQTDVKVFFFKAKGGRFVLDIRPFFLPNCHTHNHALLLWILAFVINNNDD